MGARGIKSKRSLWLLLAIVFLALGMGTVWYALAGVSPGADTRALQHGENYGRQEVVWSQGPSIEGRKVVSLSGLSAALASAVPRTTRQSVEALRLDRRYGPQRQIAMVVLRGTYNSLPPDEGVNVSGAVVVLVDVKTNRVLLLTS